ncbi:hypothetical protein [Paenibacillus sp. NAIST15-1]|uniref:hypothetical protein n=1 Tax=Paenibacillus sp. NAIST15-1 TaxID=1605994 RepID=UPI00086C26D6|nr:hypothetical protein [Paenibacillus sp. NAIST15-1]GAV11412.1 hypothetical protein PBN151_1341 [Paenibacillus sp. NAIST15-1]
MKIICKGQIKGSFRGWKNRDTEYQFVSGEKWRQEEYHYHYHYSYYPNAKVIQTARGFEMHVDGLNFGMLVKRVY